MMSTDYTLQIDWEKLTSSIGEVLSKGFTSAFQIGDSLSAISALLGAASSIKSDGTPEEKAFQLATLCFSWSLDQIVPKNENINCKVIAKSVVEKAKKEVKDYPFMPSTFIERPTTLPLYQILRDDFVEKFSPTQQSQSELSARLDAAFNRSVFELWSKRAETLASLLAALDAPGRHAHEFTREWNAYKASLIAEFEVRPVFGQEESKSPLSALYIPLRAKWRQTNEDEENQRGHDNNRNADEESETHVLFLEKILADWISRDTTDDYIRLIGGGPGSGKSTTMKAFARRIADTEDYRVLYIPLQHISLDSDLRDAVNKYFTFRTNSPFTRPPLSREAVEDGPPLILIFDGLDELSRPGEAANEVAQLFVSRLTQMLATLNVESRTTTRVIATGRMPSFQAVRKQTGSWGHKSLEVLGYLPHRDANLADTSNTTAEIDQRPLWWTKYAKLAKITETETLPPAFSDSRLSSITHEPLLCYLLALSGFASESWEAAANNRNRIYERLVDDVWSRGWGEGPKGAKRQGPGKTLSSKNFNRLMETIGLAAWLGGDARVASEAGFHDAVKIIGAEDAWLEFQNDNGSDVTNLAMNFYLKASEVEQRGFEFTHKSFGEYLCARSLLHIAEDLTVLVDRRPDTAITEWLKSTGTGTLTLEILHFLRDEVRLQVEKSNANYAEKILKSFEKIISISLIDGFPAHGNISRSWRMAETSQRNSEICAWAILNCCLQALNENKHKDFRVFNVPWPSRESFAELIRRIHHGERNEATLQCFSYIDASTSNLFGLDLSGVNFYGSILRRVDLSGSHLMHANLQASDLSNADLERANLDAAIFDNALIDGTNFMDARLSRSSFVNVTGEPAINERALLDVSSLEANDRGISNLQVIKHIDSDHTILEKAKNAKKLFTMLKKSTFHNHNGQ